MEGISNNSCAFYFTEWANGGSVEVDWNTVGKPSTKNEDEHSTTSVLKNVMRKVSSNRSFAKDDASGEISHPSVSEPLTPEKYVTETIANHIGFGENLLEIVYPGKYKIDQVQKRYISLSKPLMSMKSRVIRHIY